MGAASEVALPGAGSVSAGVSAVSWLGLLLVEMQKKSLKSFILIPDYETQFSQCRDDPHNPVWGLRVIFQQSLPREGNQKSRGETSEGGTGIPAPQPRSLSCSWCQTPLAPAPSPAPRKVGITYSTSGSEERRWASSPNESPGSQPQSWEAEQQGIPRIWQGNLKAVYLQELAGRYKHIKQILLSLQNALLKPLFPKDARCHRRRKTTHFHSFRLQKIPPHTLSSDLPPTSTIALLV